MHDERLKKIERLRKICWSVLGAKKQMRPKICVVCGREFLGRGRASYCSDACRSRAYTLIQLRLPPSAAKPNEVHTDWSAVLDRLLDAPEDEVRNYLHSLTPQEIGRLIHETTKDIPKVCPNCGREFLASKRQRFCSYTCCHQYHAREAQRRKAKRQRAENPPPSESKVVIQHEKEGDMK